MAKGSTSGDSFTTPDGIISNPQGASALAALKQAQLGEEWLNFSKEQFGISQQRQTELDTLIKPLITKQLALSDEQMGWARSDRDRYESVFKPVEDAFVAEASNYATPERQAAAAAEAKADVQNAVATAREAGIRQASAMGIDPTSGRFAGIDRSAELGGAIATAGAANNARTAVRDKGLALKADVAALGRGLPAQAASTMAQATNTATGAVGLGMQNQNLANSATGIVGSGYSGAANAWGQMGNAAANIGEQQAQDQGGLWGAIGNLAGLALGGAKPWILSDENVKEGKKPIAEGDALAAVNDMPVETWRYKEGVADGAEHVGTYAQDFQRATGEGDGTTIPVQDAIGVTMKAVQDLDAKVTRIERAVGLGRPAGKTTKATGLKRAA